MTIMHLNRRKTGAIYENTAARYLEEQGYEILERNYRCRIGEIDLIAQDNGYLVFVEVKYRTDTARGHALEAVGEKKQERIRKVALYYFMARHLPEDTPCRFDVVGITGKEISLVKDSF